MTRGHDNETPGADANDQTPADIDTMPPKSGVLKFGARAREIAEWWRPLIEVAALLLGAGWVIAELVIGNHAPAAIVSLAPIEDTNGTAVALGVTFASQQAAWVVTSASLRTEPAAAEYSPHTDRRAQRRRTSGDDGCGGYLDHLVSFDSVPPGDAYQVACPIGRPPACTRYEVQIVGHRSVPAIIAWFWPTSKGRAQAIVCPGSSQISPTRSNQGITR